MKRTKTHCIHGHAYDAANTYVDGQGYSHCRACDKARTAKYRAANAEKVRETHKNSWASRRERVNASNRLRRSVPLALIAAAPDLLEACKEFVRKVDCGEARSVRSYAQMKAAIRKAEEGAEG